VQTSNVKEGTGGYRHDNLKSNRGRLRQGFQYGYVASEGWSGADGIGAKGIENMASTSLRYFLSAVHTLQTQEATLNTG
jgi:hypothetical protein